MIIYNCTIMLQKAITAKQGWIIWNILLIIIMWNILHIIIMWNLRNAHILLGYLSVNFILCFQITIFNSLKLYLALDYCNENLLSHSHIKYWCWNQSFNLYLCSFLITGQFLLLLKASLPHVGCHNSLHLPLL